MTTARVSEQALPVRLLVVLGAAPPLVSHTVYAAHPRGFTGQMHRGPDQTRSFLEIPATDTVAAWPEQPGQDPRSLPGGMAQAGSARARPSAATHDQPMGPSIAPFMAGSPSKAAAPR